jgi:hypothetical protein
VHLEICYKSEHSSIQLCPQHRAGWGSRDHEFKSSLGYKVRLCLKILQKEHKTILGGEDYVCNISCGDGCSGYLNLSEYTHYTCAALSTEIIAQESC